jgi:hypothetical protein
MSLGEDFEDWGVLKIFGGKTTYKIKFLNGFF